MSKSLKLWIFLLIIVLAGAAVFYISGRGARAEEKYFKAVNGADIETVKEMVSKNPEIIKTQDKYGNTALHYALHHEGNDKMAEFLISAGVDVNAKDERGNAPIDSAVARCMEDFVALLIKNKADVNTANNEGRTPLHIAAKKGCGEMVLLLLNKGADVNAKDSSGRIALDIAKDKGNAKAVELLQKQGAK
ncbi:MAG: ankyrin repeat domain-containing protein [Armatimonadota bacterium]